MVFVIIAYFLAGLRESLNALLMTILISILVINVATSCGKSTEKQKIIEIKITESLYRTSIFNRFRFSSPSHGLYSSIRLHFDDHIRSIH